ncbi:MAG: hypothetical protein AB2L14_00100 [Candidatus Xenobiia bacterium LiM19]
MKKKGINAARTVKTSILFLIILSITAGNALAGNKTTQTITFVIPSINNMSVSGPPAQLEVFTRSDVQAVFEAQDSSTTYNFYTNRKNRIITGAIDQDTPNNTQLQVKFEAPSGGSSTGFVTLSTTPRTLVAGISKEKASNLPITYKLLATREAGKVPLTNRRIFYTLTGD